MSSSMPHTPYAACPSAVPVNVAGNPSNVTMPYWRAWKPVSCASTRARSCCASRPDFISFQMHKRFFPVWSMAD